MNTLIKGEIVEKYKPLVYKKVNQLINNYPYLTPLKEDLISAGFTGLIKALKSSIKKEEDNFLNFVKIYIKGEIIKEIKKHTHLLKKTDYTYKKEKIIKKLLQEDKTDEEISIYTGIKKEKINQYSKNIQIVSIDSVEGNESLQNTLKAKTNIEKEIQKKLDNQKLKQILEKAINETLTYEEKRIIEDRFLVENTKSLRTLEGELQISKETIRKKQKIALRKLKQYLIKNSIKKEDFI